MSHRKGEGEGGKISGSGERNKKIILNTSGTVIPIIVGALGAVAMLEIEKKEVDGVQFSALLGSARIQRKDVPG
jgi:hypothetical protein